MKCHIVGNYQYTRGECIFFTKQNTSGLFWVLCKRILCLSGTKWNWVELCNIHMKIPSMTRGSTCHDFVKWSNNNELLLQVFDHCVLPGSIVSKSNTNSKLTCWFYRLSRMGTNYLVLVFCNAILRLASQNHSELNSLIGWVSRWH